MKSQQQEVNQTTIHISVDEKILNSIETAKKEIEDLINVLSFSKEYKYKRENIISISAIASGSGVYFISITHNNTLGLILGLSIIATGVLMSIKSHMEYNKDLSERIVPGVNFKKRIIHPFQRKVNTVLHKIMTNIAHMIGGIEEINDLKDKKLIKRKLITFYNLLSEISFPDDNDQKYLDKLDQSIKKLEDMSLVLSTELYIKKEVRKTDEIAKEETTKLEETKVRQRIKKVATMAGERIKKVATIAHETANKEMTKLKNTKAVQKIKNVAKKADRQIKNVAKITGKIAKEAATKLEETKVVKQIKEVSTIAGKIAKEAATKLKETKLGQLLKAREEDKQKKSGNSKIL